MLKILILGGDGLLGHALRKVGTGNFNLIFCGHSEFDLTHAGQMRAQLEAIQPQLVINTAAYNLVERCEQERDFSWAVNAEGPKNLGELCAEKKIQLVHYGTDYVFDGAKNSAYTEADLPNPLNHYGAGKFAGEQAVMNASPRNLVLRTSWVFGLHPTQTKSYVHSVLNAVKAGKNLMATTDQVSAPTFVEDLADWTLKLIGKNCSGLFHAVNDEGMSRFDWTKIILAEAAQTGLIRQSVPVEPVTTDFFRSAMRRPKNSQLSNGKLAQCLGHPLGSWRLGLRKMLAQMK